MNDTHWDVFISYDSDQRQSVKEFVNQWRQLGLSVFFDQDSIQPGDPIPDKLDLGLSNSDRVVLFVSPQTASRAWVKHELRNVVFSDPDASQRRLIPVRLCPIESR